MNKKNKITEILKKSAESESKGIVEKAREQAHRLEQIAEKDMDGEREKKINKLLSDLAVERARRIGEADHKYEEIVLKAEHAIVSKIVSEVEERLSNVREDQGLYKKVMEKLLEEASRGFGDKKSVIVHVNQRDEKLVSGILSNLHKNYVVQVDAHVDFGVIVEDVQRGYSVYNTFSFRLKKAKTILLEKLAEILEMKGTE